MSTKDAFANNKRRHRNKNKNRRFLSNAKGFGKQGIFGRGTHIDDDQYNYFINILDAMNKGYEDIEEKVIMANNVFAQTQDQEIHLASNQIVCKVLESLVGFVDSENLERFFDAFAGTFRPICSDRYASHVLQKMVEIAFLRTVSKQSLKANNKEEMTVEVVPSKRAKVDLLSEEHYNLETEFSKDHRQKCDEFVQRVSKFMLNNLEDFVWDPCASHIMRTCILSLAGVHVAKVAFKKGGADMTKNSKLYTVPKEWSEVMKEFPQRLEMWPQFLDFPYQEHPSALIAVICFALKIVDKKMLKHFGKQILMDSFLKVDVDTDKKDEKIEISDNEDEAVVETEANGESTSRAQAAVTEADPAPTIKFPSVFQHQSAVMLLETLLSVAGPKLLTQLYAMLFTGRVAQLAKEQLTNFAVQKLLQNIKQQQDFENIFAEIVDHTEQLLQVGHTGIIEALTAACLRLGTKQAQLIVSLQVALHVAGDKEKCNHFFHCLVKLKPYEVMREDSSGFVHLHGSLIVQHMLHFNKPILLVNCILETPGDQLTSIFNTANGSHIVDAFLQSKFVGEKSREKLIRQLDGFYVDLAVNKFGSRVVEHLFAAAQETQKMRIVKQLADKVNMLNGSPFGRLLNSKLRIETYRLSATQWKASLQQQAHKAEQLFKDIIN